MTSLRVLIVEDDLDDLFLIQQALADLDSVPYWRLWRRIIDTCTIDTLEDALEMVSAERFDIVLLDLTLPDAQGYETFLRFDSSAPDVPVIVLAHKSDETLGVSAVRDGAQDYVLKADVEGPTLARSIRYAVERHAIETALRKASLMDELTGLYTRAAFITLADHDLRLIRHLGKSATVLYADFDGIDKLESREVRDLVLLDLAEMLRGTLPEAELIARESESGFAALIPGSTTRDELARRVQTAHDAWTRRSGDRYQLRPRVGTAQGPEGIDELLRVAAGHVCETKAYSRNGQSSHWMLLTR